MNRALILLLVALTLGGCAAVDLALGVVPFAVDLIEACVRDCPRPGPKPRLPDCSVDVPVDTCAEVKK
jgi:hypothetical protein